ncbi:hypothetical protein PsorP6_013239 [Peronosclerospora sorghi]|uniref:Uncharacterized protein n=1 Tax=Peronosclerospora sorghi TaxID=230839 RepID=A0ACC0WJ44_9STRA|nr:hypothetical protein PsorP6_013239 [Peronosclerospora sorghi]
MVYLERLVEQEMTPKKFVGELRLQVDENKKHRYTSVELERSTTSKQERETKALSSMYPVARGEKGASDERGRVSTVTATPDASSSLFDAPVYVLPSMTALYRYGHDAGQDAAELPKETLSPDNATKSRKKTKRRKKEEELETRAIVSKNEHGERSKHEADETTTLDVEQETYSTFVETFRTTMMRRA